MCSIKGCDGSVRSKGFCYKHYMKWYRYGDAEYKPEPKYNDLSGERFDLLVVSKRVGQRWLCVCDCGREVTKNTADLGRHGRTTCGDRSHLRKDEIAYHTAHGRVEQDRGKASRHTCACGRTAQHWSYDHEDPNELEDSRGIAYSAIPDFYVARCVPCHKRFDLDRLTAAPTDC